MGNRSKCLSNSLLELKSSNCVSCTIFLFQALAQVKDEIVKLSFSELREKLRNGKLSAKTVLRAYQLKVNFRYFYFRKS